MTSCCLFLCSCTLWSRFSLLPLSLLLSMFLQYIIHFSSLGFSFSVSPSASLTLQLKSLRSLYSYALYLSSASGSLSLVSTCSPSFPLPFLLWLLLLLSSFFSSDLSLSLSREFSFSCLFSVVGNAVQGCLSVRFSFVCRLLFLCSGFVFYVAEGGGGLLCFSFVVHRTGVLRCLSLPPSGVFCSFFFVLLLVFLCRSVLAWLCLLRRCPVLAFVCLFPFLCSGFVFCESEWDTPMFLSSNLRGVFLFLFSFCFGVFFAVRPLTCFVYCSGVLYLLPCLRFSFYCRSLPLLFFSSRSPVPLCLFFSLGVCHYHI